jgi:hypothetical protein
MRDQIHVASSQSSSFVLLDALHPKTSSQLRLAGIITHSKDLSALDTPLELLQSFSTTPEPLPGSACRFENPHLQDQDTLKPLPNARE